MKATPQLIRTDNLKSATALVTVGSEKEEMSQIQEHLKANPHKANRTVQAVQARNPLSESTENRLNDLVEQKAAKVEETKADNPQLEIFKPEQPQPEKPAEEAAAQPAQPAQPSQPKKRGSYHLARYALSAKCGNGFARRTNHP